MKHSILVRFTYEATHRWPDAEKVAGKEVAFFLPKRNQAYIY